MTKPKSARYWNSLRPTGLRESMDACKDHAQAMLNKSVRGIADDMGVSDHWSLYKWLESGKLPTNLIRPYERTCGQNYITGWLNTSAGHMSFPFPTGRKLKPIDFSDMHAHFAESMRLLSDFYANKAAPEVTMAALATHIEHVEWHRQNVAQHIQPQLEL